MARKEKEQVETVLVEMIGGQNQLFDVLTAVGDHKIVRPGETVEVTHEYAEHLIKRNYAKMKEAQDGAEL